MKTIQQDEANHKKVSGSNQYEADVKKKTMAKKMTVGIHRVGDNPSRFVHKGRKGDIDLYESWKGGKQSIKSTK